MNRKILILFFGVFLLLGMNFVSAEKMWNFNNHTVNISDDLYVGGTIYGALSAGDSLWNESGPYIYPYDLSKNIGIGKNDPAYSLDMVGDRIKLYNPSAAVLELSSYYGRGSTPYVLNVSEGSFHIDGSGYHFMTFSNVRGYIGIGTRTPQNELNVIGDLNVTGTIYGASFDGVESYWNQSGDYIYPANLSKDVGIGTSNPGEKLDVAGNINATGDICITGGNCLSGVLGESDSLWNESGDYLYPANLSKNVGIGTATPSELFVIGDDLGNLGTTNSLVIGEISSNPSLFLGSATTSYGKIYWDDSQKSISFQTTNAGSTYLNTLLMKDGNVAVGRNSFDAKLKVSNNDAIDSFRVDDVSFDTTPFIIDASGNVGIGTITPSSKLNIYRDDSDLSGMLVLENGGSGDASMTYKLSGGQTFTQGIDNDYDSLKLSYSGSDAGSNTSMVWRNNGYVGVGTGDLPTSPFVVSQNNAPSSIATGIYTNLGGDEYGSNSYRLIGFGYSSNTYPPAFMGYHEVSDGGYTRGDLIFGTRSSESNVVASTRMIIKDDGKVGIGTSYPEVQLHINGSNPIIQIEGAGPNGGLIIGQGDNGNTYIWNNDPGNMSFGLNGVPVLDLVPNGGDIRVGIGTSSPSSRLAVENVGSANDVLLLRDSSGTCEAQPTTTGLTWSCSSDVRLKKDIVDAKSMSEYFSKFRIRDYTVKKTGERVTGVIAQEVREIYPEMVSEGDDGYLMVSEPSPWQFVKVIQEQQEQLDNLKNELNDLKKEFEVLKTRINNE